LNVTDSKTALQVCENDDEDDVVMEIGEIGARSRRWAPRGSRAGQTSATRCSER
jgi:hypothetical protein